MKITILSHMTIDHDYFSNIIKEIEKNLKGEYNIIYNCNKINNIDTLVGLKFYAISEPFKTIDYIYNVLDKNEKERNFRWNMIRSETGYDLSEYNKVEAACLSYLLWSEVVKKYDIDLFFREEDPNSLIKYFRGMDILADDYRVLVKTHVKYVPKDLKMYKQVSFATLNLISIYCKKYKYYNHLLDLK